MRLNRADIRILIVLVTICIFATSYLRDSLIKIEFKKISNNLESNINRVDLWFGEKEVNIGTNKDFAKKYHWLLALAQSNKRYIRGGDYDLYVFDIFLNDGKKIYLTVRIDFKENDLFIDVAYKKKMVFKYSIVNNPEALRACQVFCVKHFLDSQTSFKFYG